MSTLRRISAWILGCLLAVSPAGAVPVHQLLAVFEDPPQNPSAGALLLAPDGYYWGTTAYGGPHAVGTIFKMKPDGTDLTTVFAFTNDGSENRGLVPEAGLVSDGAGFLWGTTSFGGLTGDGTIFKVNVATGELTTVLKFDAYGTTNLGSRPMATLVSDSSGFLWGTTLGRGSDTSWGTIFKINTSTNELITVVRFSNLQQQVKGFRPCAGLVGDGAGSFWGTTVGGGASLKGTVFKVDISTGVLTTIVEFTGTTGAVKGSGLYSGLVGDDAGFFWGMTSDLGANGVGTVFKINKTTGEFMTVAEFGGTTAYAFSGAPAGTLCNDGAGALWGTTYSGGAYDKGTVFKVDIATGTFTKVIDFQGTGPGVQGSFPQGTLVNNGAGSLLGSTSGGGASGFAGTIYKIDIATGALTTLVDFGVGPASRPFTGLVADNAGQFWGSTTAGGTYGCGTIFKFNPTTGQLTTVVSLTGISGPYPGSKPQAALSLDGSGLLWGTTTKGGMNDLGTVFKIDPVTGILTTLVEFTGNGDQNKGAEPYGLVNDGAGSFLGVTAAGGAADYGTIFKINMQTGALSTLVEFSGTAGTSKGRKPVGGLTDDGAGSFVGTTSLGGIYDDGTIFRLNPNTGTITTLVEMNSAAAPTNSSSPRSALISDGAGFFWGTGADGYAHTSNSVFKMNATSNVLTKIVSMPGGGPTGNGNGPFGGLASDGAGYLWGTTRLSSINNSGTVFKVNTATGAFTTVFRFTGYGSDADSGSQPVYMTLLKGNDGHFYGTTSLGGPRGGGTIFRMWRGPTPTTLPADVRSQVAASLHGTLNPNGTSSVASFEWGTSPSLLGSTTIAAGTTGTGLSPEAITASLTGLQPSTTYYFRIVGGNSENSVPQRGEILSFTTPDAIPTIALNGPNPLRVRASDSFTDPGASANDTEDGSLTPAITANSVIPNLPGTYSVTWSATDSAHETVSVTRTVIVRPASPIHATIGLTKSAVPGAGTDPRIQTGSLWTSFNPPAVGDNGDVVYLARWAAPASGGSSAQFGIGIFRNETLVTKAGDQVPGQAQGVVFKGFKDPVIDATGHIAFLATMTGPQITDRNDGVVVSDGRTGALEIIAQEGSGAPGAEGATFRSFTNVSIRGTPAFTAKLGPENRASSITNSNDVGAWWWPSGEASLIKIIREGDPAFTSGDTIKTFQMLAAVSGSTGHGRGQTGPDSALLQVTTALGKQAIVLALPGTLTATTMTGDTLGGVQLPSSRWNSLNLPSSEALNTYITVLGNLFPDDTGIDRTTARGIFLSADGGETWEPIARTGKQADALGASATFAGFSDPVHSSTGSGLAFIASALGAKGSSVGPSNNDAIWWKSSADSPLAVLVREDDQATGAASGVKWKSFLSLAYPGGLGGPIFTAKLKGAPSGPARVTDKNDIGFYGVDSFGFVQELLCEGKTIAGKTVKKFTVLNAASGSAGVSRSFNAASQAVALVTYTDGTTGLVKIELP